MYFDALEKLSFITKHKADCKVSYSKQIFPFQLDHPYIFTKKTDHSGLSFFSQVNAKAPAASAHAEEERTHDDFQQDTPQPLQPACADENALDAWTNHPDVKARDSQ